MRYSLGLFSLRYLEIRSSSARWRVANRPSDCARRQTGIFRAVRRADALDVKRPNRKSKPPIYQAEGGARDCAASCIDRHRNFLTNRVRASDACAITVRPNIPPLLNTAWER